MSSHPITISLVAEPLERSRLTSFFRPLLAIPHIVWLYLWQIVAALAFVIGWVIALFTGRVPNVLHSIIAAQLSYSVHVIAYLTIMADRFPAFSGSGDYPVHLTVGGPEKQGRWGVLFRPLLAFPALVIANLVFAPVVLGGVFFWVRVLFTGKVSPGLLRLMTYGMRYQYQSRGYLFLVTGQYPDANPLFEASQ